MMFAHDAYAAKSLEYVVGLASLGVFVVFWRWVQGGATAMTAHVADAVGHLAEWFRMPMGVSFHPGHAWARRESPGIVTVGLDDFAQQLVGPLSGVRLPQPGDDVREGHVAWALDVDDTRIDMLAPVTGTVVAINQDLLAHPELANADPYGRGWLMKLRVPSVTKALEPLAAGARAKAWMESVSRQLTASMTPELGQLCQDGGMPVAGFARSIDEVAWDEVARRFLLTPSAPPADAPHRV